MTLVLNQVFKFIKLLNSDKGTNQIAAGFVCGMFLGFTPAFSLQTLLVIFCIFFFRIQMGAALLTAAVFAIPGIALSTVFHGVGSWALEIETLRPLYTALYQMPIIPFTRFNHSIVMGSGVVALVLAIPVFILSKVLIEKYREKVVERFKNSKFFKALKATSLYQWYTKYEQLRG